MRNLSSILLICVILSSLIGCKKSNDSTYFNGKIYPIDDRLKQVKNVSLKPVSLDGAYYGWISAYDSLIFFMNKKLPGQFFNVFNVDTGQELGSFCNRGGGPGEVFSITPIFQFFEEEKELKTLFYAPNERKLLIWNITQSLAQNTTVWDTITPYSLDEENKGAHYDYLFRQNKDILFTYVQSISLDEKEATVPFYQKRTFYSNERLVNYSVYKKAVRNGNASVIPEVFFSSNTAFKPDASKIIQCMLRLPQFNILNTETGDITGYRMPKSPDFTIFEKEGIILTQYYIRAQADERYIYTTYWGKEPWAKRENPNIVPYINNIHVYDWNGKWLYELITDQPVHEIWLDNIRNRLYTTNMETDEVFYVDLNELDLK